ncbi:AEC family transporter [Amorphus sp. 3PC139-8]|uniref:AEC family transporter n=1 Tax=Amorphus sp. 3PC139-8 TaxID=2735676 RepID=UPI00345DAB90
MSIEALIGVILPVFGLIGIGYLVVWVGLIGEEVGDALTDFVFKVSLPLLLFRTLATVGWPDESPWPFWLAYFSGVAVVWWLSGAIIRRGFGRDARAAVVAGMSAGYSNIVLLGVPVVNQAYGDEGLVVILVLVSVHLSVMMTASAVQTELAQQRDGLSQERIDPMGIARRVLLALIQNPIILGTLAGALFSASGFAFEGVPRTLVDRIADIAIPSALLALGMGLRRYGLRGSIGPALAISVLKLFVLPAIVFVMARYVVQLPPLYVAVATLVAGCPTGVNAYLIAARIGTGQALSATAITVTTAGSVLTIGLWLAVVTG